MATAEAPAGYLLDTHALVWLATDDPRLTKKVKDLVLNRENVLWLSVVAVWELAIKRSLGRVETSVPLATLLLGQSAALGTRTLDIRLEHALLVEELPFHHRDPFDRLLVAQALQENFHLVSADRAFDAYPTTRVW